MTTFRAVGSVRRGAIEPPEELDERGQVAALSRLRYEASMEVRVHWERTLVLKMLDGDVESAAKRLAVSGEPPARVKRLMKLAGAA